MTPGNRGSTKKMEWTHQRHPDASHVKLCGALTQTADFDAIVEQLPEGPVVVDLSEVVRVNSIGVRHWVDFIARLCEGRSVQLQACSPAFVEQLMLIDRMQGDATVESIHLPFLCEDCDEDHEVPLIIAAGVELPTIAPCPRCGEDTELDDLPERYTSLLTRLSASS